MVDTSVLVIPDDAAVVAVEISEVGDSALGAFASLSRVAWLWFVLEITSVRIDSLPKIRL